MSGCSTRQMTAVAPSHWSGPRLRMTTRRYATRSCLVPGDSNGAATEKKVIAEFPANSRYVRETKSPWWTRPANPNDHQYDVKSGKGVELKTGTPYSFVVAAVKGTDRAEAPSVQGIPGPNWINWNQMNNLLLVLLFGGVVFWSIKTARRREIFLRRIPGLDAVDEAIGRATELGKPILYLTGAGDMSEPSTIAAAVILGRVGKRVAAYETQLMVPHRDPIVMAVCQEVTKQSYLEAGKPDVFKEDSNFFITTDQFSYTAAVDGLMLRRRPAANFFMGSYFAESLLLTETGASTGAIQIAGTDSDHQLPILRHDLRLHVDRRGAVRRQRVSVARAGSGRHPAGTGYRKRVYSDRDRAGSGAGDDRRAVQYGLPDGPARSLQGSEMIFLRRQLPLLITFVTGILFIGQYYVPHPASEQMLTTVSKWLQIIGGFALVLGITSLFHQHAVKIRRKEPGWGYSFVLYAGMIGTIAIGLWMNGKESVNGSMTPFGWIYSYHLGASAGDDVCDLGVLHRLSGLSLVSGAEP